MDTLQKISTYNRSTIFIDQEIIPHGITIVVGLSGGADSVCLLYQLAALRVEKNLTLIAAHLDHEWRAESKQDAQFCKELCEKLTITYVVKTPNQLSFTPKDTGSKEDVGRQLRRYFFEAVAQEYGTHTIALAHHQDDQLETFFIRIIRGTTIQGLGCMQSQDITSNGLVYIRPLLSISKAKILEYLDVHAYTYVQDASNFSDAYLRNRIRHTALPALQTCDPRFSTKCLELIKHLQETELFIKETIEITYKQITEYPPEATGAAHTTGGSKLDYVKLLTLDMYTQKRILQTWLLENHVPFNPSEKFLQEIMRFCSQKKAQSHQISGTWQLVKIGSWLTIK